MADQKNQEKRNPNCVGVYCDVCDGEKNQEDIDKFWNNRDDEGNLNSTREDLVELLSKEREKMRSEFAKTGCCFIGCTEDMAEKIRSEAKKEILDLIGKFEEYGGGMDDHAREIIEEINNKIR